jgi:hypothetical protein
MYTLFYVTQKIYSTFNAPNLLPYKGLSGYNEVCGVALYIHPRRPRGELYGVRGDGRVFCVVRRNLLGHLCADDYVLFC